MMYIKYSRTQSQLMNRLPYHVHQIVCFVLHLLLPLRYVYWFREFAKKDADPFCQYYLKVNSQKK